MNAIWIDHEFHKRTGSFDFLRKWIESFGHIVIEEVYIDPSKSLSHITNQVQHVLEREDVAIILCQLDFLAPIFSSRSMPVIVIPMYDGSELMPLEHWRSLQESLIINFSTNLHARCLAAECNTKYIKYIPEENDSREGITKTNNQTLDIIWWIRKNHGAVSIHNVAKFCNSLDSYNIHFHISLDSASNSYDTVIDQIRSSFTGASKITYSTWFESRESYLDLLRSADIYIAPRETEGIGMSFLEAMNCGCCVVALDMPTHNEYITNGLNGILVNTAYNSSKEKYDPFKIREMGLHAKQSLEMWRAYLQNNIFVLRDSINDYLDMHACSISTLSARPVEVSSHIKAWQNGSSSYVIHLSRIISHNFSAPARSSFLSAINAGASIESKTSQSISSSHNSDYGIKAAIVIVHKNLLFISRQLRQRQSTRLIGIGMQIFLIFSTRMLPPSTKESLLSQYERYMHGN